MQAGHGVLQSGERRTVPSSTESNSNLSKAWGLRLTSNVPALLESTHKPGVHDKPMETRTYLRFTAVFFIFHETVMCVDNAGVFQYSLLYCALGWE